MRLVRLNYVLVLYISVRNLMNCFGMLFIVFLSFSSCRLLSDISRLEAKVERLDAQLQAKDREIATITRTVFISIFFF